MRNWLRRWLGIEQVGSLTLFADGRVLVSMPTSMPSRAEVENVRLRLEEWLASPDRRTLVLPFPVIVRDER